MGRGGGPTRQAVDAHASGIPRYAGPEPGSRYVCVPLHALRIAPACHHDQTPHAARSSASVVAAAGTAVASRLFAQSAGQPATSRAARDITVYKDPNCGCCTEWVKHLRQAGFTVTVRDTAETEMVKRSFGVPAALESCHTGRIGKYTIEGHVPADLIIKLVSEQPAARGLAVPGMPIGSPGMDGSPKQAYEVLLFDAAGKTSVYARR